MPMATCQVPLAAIPEALWLWHIFKCMDRYIDILCIYIYIETDSHLGVDRIWIFQKIPTKMGTSLNISYYIYFRMIMYACNYFYVYSCNIICRFPGYTTSYTNWIQTWYIAATRTRTLEWKGSNIWHDIEWMRHVKLANSFCIYWTYDFFLAVLDMHIHLYCIRI